MRVRASSVPLNETAMKQHLGVKLTGYGAYYRKNLGIASILWIDRRYADWTGLRLSITTSNTTERT